MPCVYTRYDEWFGLIVWNTNILIFLFTWQENISRNYHSIRLKPDQFSSYLTTEVGFTSFEYLGAPKCSIRGKSLIWQNKWMHYVTHHCILISFSIFLSIATGFQRPIYLFHKWPLLPWSLWMWVAWTTTTHTSQPAALDCKESSGSLTATPATQQCWRWNSGRRTGPKVDLLS